MLRLFIRQLRFILPSLGGAVLLAGCATGPDQLGFSKSQWQSLPQNKQKQALHAYSIIHHNLMDYAKPKQTAVPQTQRPMQTMSMQPNTIAPPIQMTLVQGLAVFPPNFNPPTAFQPLSFNLQPGTCSQHILLSLDGQNQTPLWVCYVKNLVAIDPSMTDLNSAWGTLYINLNPLWHLGFNYTQLHSHGYVSLQQTTIAIKASTPFVFNRPTQEDAIPFESTETQHTMKKPTKKTLPALTAPQNLVSNQEQHHAG